MQIIPGARLDHRPRKQLRTCQNTATAGQGVWVAVLTQAPTGIKRLAKHLWAMPCHNGLKTHLARHGINCNSPFHQRPRADRPVKQLDLAAGVFSTEIALPKALARLGVGLDDNACAGVILLRVVKHFLKRICIGAPVRHRSIAARLVNHQNIARIGAGGSRVKPRIFA